MPAGKLELPVENPSALIRSRIREKRIFEARFLYRQLGAEIGEQEKNALEQEVAVSLAQVKKLQQQARNYTAQGQNGLAAQLYMDIEQIAIDVPGLAEEKKALAGAEALAARMTSKTVARNPAVLEPTVTSAKADQVQPPVAVVQPPRQRWSRRWLFVGLAGCVTVLLLILWGLREKKTLSAPSAPSLAQPTQKIFIRPLTTSSPTTGDDQPPDRESGQSEPKVGPEPSSVPSVQVETLQIQKSVRE